MTAWSRRLNAASRTGAGEQSSKRREVMADVEAAGVDPNGVATISAMLHLARERPDYAMTVEVGTESGGTVSFRVAAGVGGPSVSAVGGSSGGGAAAEPAGGDDILTILTDTLVETPDLVAIFASVGHEALWANDAFVTAIPIRQADKIWLVELLDEWSKGQYEVKVLPALVKFGRWRGRLTLLTGEETTTAMSVVIVAHRDHEGEITAVSMVARPMPELAAAGEAGAGDSQFAALVEQSTDMIAVLGTDALINYASPAVGTVLGFEADDLVGRNLLELALGDDAPSTISELVRVDDLGVGEPASLQLQAADGTVRHLEVIVSDLTENPSIAGFVLNGRDVTDRVSGISEVAARAYTDSLTGLPGRMRILDRLAGLLIEDQHPATVLLFDFDRLTGINETFGRPAGDQVLQTVAERLAANIEDDQLVGRLGSDEFVVVLPGGDIADGVRIANRLRVASAEPIDVGVATGQAGDEADALITNAGRAMAHAKASGRDRVEVFTDHLAAIATRRRTAEQQLRRALDNDGVGVHYQPIIDIAQGVTIGAEALLRVAEADGALLSPAEFIEAAESTGLITRLGQQVLEITCGQLADWSSGSAIELAEISVNISPRQLADPELPTRIVDTLNTAGIAPERLCLEIGESILIGAQPTVDATISYLRALGVRIGLDDFGAGQSSLGYLKRFPLDFVKIDRALIGGLGTDEQDTAIVRATIELAHNLGLKVVAVGVEYAEQLEMLQILNCDKAQGYLFAPALKADEFSEQVAAGFDRG